MPSEPRYRIESHPRAATLYVTGPLTVATAMCAARLFDSLPAAVANLRVDLTAARMTDATPVQALAMMLARWRRRVGESRRTRLELPPAGKRPPPAVLSPRTPRAPRRPRAVTGP